MSDAFVLLGKLIVGDTLQVPRLYDLLHPKKEPNGDEIAADIIKRAGLKFGDKII